MVTADSVVKQKREFLEIIRDGVKPALSPASVSQIVLLEGAGGKSSSREEFRVAAVAQQRMGCFRVGFIVHGQVVIGGGNESETALGTAASAAVLRRGAFFLAAEATNPWGEHSSALGAERARVLRFEIRPNGAFIQESHRAEPGRAPKPGVLVRDEQLMPMAALLYDELVRYGDKQSAGVARALMLALTLRIERRLLARRLAPLQGTARYELAPNLTAGDERSPVIERSLNYIEAHLDEPLNPGTIARYAFVSPAHLNRVFRQKLNMTVMDCVTRYRVETAKSLLSGTDLSVKEVSRLSGYAHSSHFCKVFLALAREKPSDFRRRSRAEGVPG